MTRISIAAVGDVLMWAPQIEAARTDNDSFSFDYVFEPVAPFLRGADLAIGNLETTLSGREETYVASHPNGPWPRFNCPDELADALKRAGFGVMTTANNHCMDRGGEGACRTLDVLDGRGILHTGTYRTEEESNEDLIVEVKGIKIAILAYTYGTNLIPAPAGKPWMVNLIDRRMLQRIRRAKRDADLTILCLHMGVEHAEWSSPRQRYWVNACFEHGADIVLGCHPHVLQPTESVLVRDLDGVAKRRFVIYSLGNFSSRNMGSFRTLTGVILELSARRRVDGLVEVEEAGYTPTWVDETDGYKVVPLARRLRDDPPRDSRARAMQTALDYATRHLVSSHRPKRPLWTPSELANLARGRWLRQPKLPFWAPDKVRAPQKGPDADLDARWLQGILFVRTEKQLKRWFGDRRNEGVFASGCVVVPPSLELSANLPRARAVLVAPGVEGALQALALCARRRFRGKVVLVAGTHKRTEARKVLVKILEGRAANVSTNVDGLATFSHLVQFLASADPEADYIVYECAAPAGSGDFRSLSALLEPDVLLVTGMGEADKRRPEDYLQLAEDLRPNGWVILNTQMRAFERLRLLMAGEHKLLTFGGPGGDIRVREAEDGLLDVSVGEKRLGSLTADGEGSDVTAGLAAMAAAAALGLSPPMQGDRL
ncbi:CapA family protein [Ciceribacter sp. RN22]|uniref:CapA family protein n=1 Tax=Ciceribacter sp. RN22 TaxID=2954932 RepID=UPI002092E216|nr:CapA family protein [Ciceribacter sp. RN22]MCO6180978.1 CapA family protein [Ciceribacter sp. RN22]